MSSNSSPLLTAWATTPHVERREKEGDQTDFSCSSSFKLKQSNNLDACMYHLGRRKKYPANAVEQTSNSSSANRLLTSPLQRAALKTRFEAALNNFLKFQASGNFKVNIPCKLLNGLTLCGIFEATSLSILCVYDFEGRAAAQL